MPLASRTSGDHFTVVPLLALGLALVLALAVAFVVRRRRDFGSTADRATYVTLHRASLAGRTLRDGLTPDGATRSARHLRALLDTTALALTDASGSTLAWDGAGTHHASQAGRHAAQVLATGRTVVLGEDVVACDDPTCSVRRAVIAPLVSDETVVGALAAYGRATSPGLVRATDEVAAWVSDQVELAELDHERTRAVEAELRALRAQISPHFLYNALTAIATFVRTDPERARELLVEFAEFTRYAFRSGGEFTSLADELRNVERYVELERARFGDRLQLSLLVAPEVLQTAVPFLVIQPLVENAIRHGLEAREGVGNITVTASDHETWTTVVVEDDGVGSDPDDVRAALAGESDRDSVGLANVDARLRQVYGDRHGLVVETAPGAGTRVSFTLPKFSPGVSAR
ncbi:MAG TPA: histidine kinase [Actinomycetales bacterium]|nr:histidine kinase [Actinomycetales bacterium]